MHLRKTLVRKSTGLRLESRKRLPAQTKLRAQHHVPKPPLPNQPRVLSDAAGAQKVFDLGVITALAYRIPLRPVLVDTRTRDMIGAC
jgi:hypothetical protein